MNIPLKNKNDKNEKISSGDASEKTTVFDVFEIFAVSLLVLTLIFTFLFRIVDVKGESMKPTLQDGDRLIVTSFLYKPRRGDVVVVSGSSRYEKPLVKRVIAVGGDVVDIDFTKGIVTVNGEKEAYKDGITFLQYDVTFPLTVEEGKVFILGDNRGDSLDSRSSTIGCVDEKSIVGRALGRIYPFGRWTIDDYE